MEEQESLSMLRFPIDSVLAEISDLMTSQVLRWKKDKPLKSLKLES